MSGYHHNRRIDCRDIPDRSYTEAMERSAMDWMMGKIALKISHSMLVFVLSSNPLWPAQSDYSTYHECRLSCVYHCQHL